MKPTNIAHHNEALWYWLYTLLLTVGLPMILGTLLVKKRCRNGLWQRIGWIPDRIRKIHRNAPVLWIHAVSMGEATAVAPLVPHLKARYPHHRLLVSTTTETGRQIVLTNMLEMADHFYFPLDHPWIVNRVLDVIRPQAVVIVETELWPNFLRALHRRRIPAVLINGRLSTTSFRRYLAVRPFMKHVVRLLSACAMQSRRDAERIQALGAEPDRVVNTGNIKCDHTLPDRRDDSLQCREDVLGLRENEELLIAGSTHPGEEEAILNAYRALLLEFPTLVLLIAPRHLERVHDVERVVRSWGFVPVRRTALPVSNQNGKPDTECLDPVPGADRAVIILDTHGELFRMYRFAAVVWVGGSWVPVGGHNLLEPAQWGRPILFGPHMDHVSEMAEAMVASGGGLQVWSQAEMTEQIAAVLRDRKKREAMGDAARRVVLENRGALHRTLSVIDSVLCDQDSAHGCKAVDGPVASRES